MIQAVVGILQRNDTVLIAERPSGKPYAGYWEFPGGKIDQDESAEAALYRELQEELGIHIIQASHCLDYAYDYPDKSVWLSVWVVNDYEGEPRGLEGQQLRWVKWDEFQHYHLLAGNIALSQLIKSKLSILTHT